MLNGLQMIGAAILLCREKGDPNYQKKSSGGPIVEQWYTSVNSYNPCSRSGHLYLPYTLIFITVLYSSHVSLKMFCLFFKIFSLIVSVPIELPRFKRCTPIWVKPVGTKSQLLPKMPFDCSPNPKLDQIGGYSKRG